MRRVLATILLAAILAAQTTGLTQSLHLILEHDFGCPEHDSCCTTAHLPAGCNGNRIVADDGPQHRHDHSHCAACQAMATFQLSPVPTPVMLAPLGQHHIQLASAISLPPIMYPLHTLSPRAPPPALLVVSV